MKQIIITAVLVLFLNTASFAQTGNIKGIVVDNTDTLALPGATVSLLLQADSSLVKTTTTLKDGTFNFTEIATDSFIVTVTSVGYQQYISFINISGSERNLGSLKLYKQGKDLSVVTIVSKASPVIQRGDTSQFSASQFKVNPDATTEDLIKKMPGITVDKDGTVTAQGEQVRKVTVDGRDFFGDDASAALKNLPSEVVDKIQVFDRLSDQAQLTGFDDGNSQKSINIVTKSGIKNGQFGRAFAGYGTDERYAAGGNISFFKKNRRFSLVGNFNNINQQNFASQDLLGLTSSANRGGGGQRGGGGGGRPGGGGSDNFNVGQASGISKTNAFGINFSNQWSPKMTIAGSYFFNNSKNNNESIINTETFSNPKHQFANQFVNSVTKNTNHRINLRLEYKLDSSNSIFIIPNISFQNNNSSSLSLLNSFYGINDSINTSRVNNRAERNGYNIRNNILYRHSFAKRGRTISLGFNTNYTKNNSETISEGQYRFFSNGSIDDSTQNQFYDNATNGRTFGGTIAYTEPLSLKSQLQFDYSPSVQKNKADQQTFSYDGQKYSMFDSSLSNKFDNTITTNNAGVSYRLNPSRDEQFSAGINFQNAKLESQRIFPAPSTVNQSFSNILPNLMWRKKLSAVSNIRLFYRASTNFPSINQLQDVVNITNPLRISSGNPDLTQSYTQLLSGRYTYTNSKTSRSFFANLFLQTAADYISNAIYIPQNGDSLIQNNIELNRGSQLTKPVNLDGYKSLRTFFTYSMPIKKLKTNINLNAGFNYSKLPGLVNNFTTNTDNYVYNTGVVFASNISEFVDFNISYNVNFNEAKTNSAFSSNNSYVNQAAGVQFNLLNKKGWFLQNDVSYQAYTGLTEGFNQKYTLWNAAVGKKFLKNNAGELKLSVFDLLKENQSIIRTVTNNYIEDSQSQVLQQFFMLTFTYNLKNFGVATRNNERGRNQDGMRSEQRERGMGNPTRF
ncbi:MAG: TonB-dependent receptor [Ferruginibacter sp.]